MLIEPVRKFLDGPRFGALCYADADGRPVLARTLGWAYGDGGADLAFATRSDLMPWTPPLDVPFRVAVVISRGDRFEAMQLKGIARVRRASPADIAHARTMMTALGEVVQSVSGVSAELYRNVVGDEALVFDVVVEEAYQGSPGPGAGARLGADAAGTGGAA
jgi:hypothetical protein